MIESEKSIDRMQSQIEKLGYEFFYSSVESTWWWKQGATISAKQFPTKELVLLSAALNFGATQQEALDAAAMSVEETQAALANMREDIAKARATDEKACSALAEARTALEKSLVVIRDLRKEIHDLKKTIHALERDPRFD
jgi:DNA repair exonuclease SbcCD ATPase subunit